MDIIFKDYEFIFVYIDDILILSNNVNLHLKHLDIFADLCIKHGLALSEKKTSLLQEKIDFLGMKIYGKGIELQSHILEKITAFPNKLVDKKQVQSFLGILNYASDFIKNLAEAVEKAVYPILSGCIFICQNPLLQSNLENIFLFLVQFIRLSL